MDLDETATVEAVRNYEATTRVTARVASDVRAAAISGWNNADSLRAAAVSNRKSGATLLVPDSDDES